MSVHASIVIVRTQDDADVTVTIMTGSDVKTLQFPASAAGGAYSLAWNYLSSVLPLGVPVLLQSEMSMVVGNYLALEQGGRQRVNWVS